MCCAVPPLDLNISEDDELEPESQSQSQPEPETESEYQVAEPEPEAQPRSLFAPPQPIQPVELTRKARSTGLMCSGLKFVVV